MTTTRQKRPSLTPRLLDIMQSLNNMDPLHKIAAARALSDELLGIHAMLAESRRAGVRQLRADGYTLEAIGHALGMSSSRVGQIEKGEVDHDPRMRHTTGITTDKPRWPPHKLPPRKRQPAGRAAPRKRKPAPSKAKPPLDEATLAHIRDVADY